MFPDFRTLLVKVPLCINAEVTIGEHCIINIASTIKHDCVIEDFVHISPKATLAENIIVKKCAHIGIGAKHYSRRNHRKHAVIGAEQLF